MSWYAGTPLQNDLHELHNLLLFLVPDVFKELPQLEDSGVRLGSWLACGGLLLAPCSVHALVCRSLR